MRGLRYPYVQAVTSRHDDVSDMADVAALEWERAWRREFVLNRELERAWGRALPALRRDWRATWRLARRGRGWRRNLLTVSFTRAQVRPSRTLKRRRRLARSRIAAQRGDPSRPRPADLARPLAGPA